MSGVGCGLVIETNKKFKRKSLLVSKMTGLKGLFNIFRQDDDRVLRDIDLVREQQFSMVQVGVNRLLELFNDSGANVAHIGNTTNRIVDKCLDMFGYGISYIPDLKAQKKDATPLVEFESGSRGNMLNSNPRSVGQFKLELRKLCLPYRLFGQFFRVFPRFPGVCRLLFHDVSLALDCEESFLCRIGVSFGGAGELIKMASMFFQEASLQNQSNSLQDTNRNEAGSKDHKPKCVPGEFSGRLILVSICAAGFYSWSFYL